MMAGALPEQTAVPRDIGFFEWFFDADTWTGSGGIIESLIDTVLLCAAATAVAALIAVPVAAVLAHYRKAQVASTWLVSLSRAVPTFAIAALLVPWSLRRGWGFERSGRCRRSRSTPPGHWGTESRPCSGASSSRWVHR
jgi:ABC-type nitrate/sulfonate/bicarbonate transport system permease component